MKLKLFTVLIIFFLSATLSAQTVSQVAFVIKKALPEVQNIAVIFPNALKAKITGEAKTAQLVSRKKVSIYGVARKTDIAAEMFNIRRLKKAALIIIADEKVLTKKSVKYIVDKLMAKGVAIISTRSKDTLQGTFMTVVAQNGTMIKSVNKISAASVKMKIDNAYINTCTVDVE